MHLREVYPIKLDIGIKYIVQFKNSNHKIHCLFIKTTKKGFNFLNIKTNKCIFKRVMYKSKCENHKSSSVFFVNKNINIEKIK